LSPIVCAFVIVANRPSPLAALILALMKKSETPQSARVIFGQNVRRVRRLKEMSQEELAFRADISRTYLSEVERGERNISVDNMEALALALEMELPDLMRTSLISLPSEDSR